jgi:hypothetical protein
MKTLLMLLILSLAVFGQTRNRDLGSSNVRQGATLPSTCQASPNADVFYKSGANAGLYTCTATNTWAVALPAGTITPYLSFPSAGNVRVTDGSTGYGGLTAGSLTTVALATPTITSVTPGANDGVTCTYTLTAYDGPGNYTAASATSSTAIGSTGCAGTVIAWPKDTAVTRYQLSRTVGGTTQGLITAMAAWLNNTTNCPAACSYTDTGSAASGSAPTANTTGRGVFGGNISATGTISSGGAIVLGATGELRGGSGTKLYDTGDGYWSMYTNDWSTFNCLRFGGSTSAFGAVCRDGAGIKIRAASNDAYAPLTSGTLRVTATASSTLTGTADPTASTTLVGTGTDFLNQLVGGDRVTVNAETRTIVSCATALECTVDVAFTDTGAAAITRLPPLMNLRDSAGTGVIRVDSSGNLLWNVDGGGSIGASGANRPDSVYALTNIDALNGFVRGFNVYSNGGKFGFSNGSHFKSPSDGVLTALDGVETSFARLQLGGTTNAFPAIKRSGSAIQLRLADDSAYASLHTRSVNFTAQTECACAAYTNFVVDATTNTIITSASYNFVAADVGSILQVTGGAGWTVGDYTIASVAANAATLDRSSAAVTVGSGEANIGRGRTMMVQGGAGVADTLRICTKDGANAYGWRATF